MLSKWLWRHGSILHNVCNKTKGTELHMLLDCKHWYPIFCSQCSSVIFTLTVLHPLSDIQTRTDKDSVSSEALCYKQSLINCSTTTFSCSICKPCCTSGTTRRNDKDHLLIASDHTMLCSDKHRQINIESSPVVLMLFGEWGNCFHLHDTVANNNSHLCSFK